MDNKSLLDERVDRSKMRVALSAILVLTLLGLAIPQRRAYACGCLDMPLSDKFNSADVVFAGTVSDPPATKSSEEPSVEQAVFHVTRAWKGDVGSTVMVESDVQICGLRFTIDEEYLVFARTDPGSSPGVVIPDPCSTHTMSFSSDTLVALGPGYAPGEVPENAGLKQPQFAPGIIAGVGAGIVVVAIIVGAVVARRKR